MRNNKATQSSGLNGAGSVLAYSSRDSTRIVKHTFDAAKIDIISESCKYFSDYFKFFRVKPTIFDKEVRGTEDLGMTAAMTQIPVPSTTTSNRDIIIIF